MNFTFLSINNSRFRNVHFIRETEHKKVYMKEGASEFPWICMSTEVYSPEMGAASTGSYFSNLADACCPPFAEEQYLVCDSIHKLD